VAALSADARQGNPHLDPDLKPLRLSDADARCLVAFLEALTGAGR
jgi:hypothetical protein